MKTLAASADDATVAQPASLARRQFVATAPALLLGAAVLPACTNGADPESYEAIAAQIRRTDAAADIRANAFPADLARDQVHELVRLATLAPSSHNTQCWKFAVGEAGITIAPDFTRRCPVVDPDDHHVFVTLGCATENLVHAALAHGLQAQVQFDATQQVIRVGLVPTKAEATALFRAIPLRQCTRGDYDAQPIGKEELRLLEQSGTAPGVRVMILPERAAMERVLETVVQGNTAQIANPAFIREIKSWIRFNRADAARTRDGLFSLSSGSPAIPTWLGELAFGWLFTAKGENDKIARQIRSSAGIAIFVGEAADPAHWVAVGRAYERFALQATALDIRTAFLNQPVEVAAVRPGFAADLGISGQRPDLVVRFGRGPTLPPSLRRPVQAVMV